MADSARWHSLPPIELPTPLLSLLPPAAESPDGPLWIGGVGGVAAWWPNGVTGGEPSLSDATAPVALTLGLSAVAALCRIGGWLVAGGSEGIVRWRESEVKADGVLDAEVEVAEVQSGGAMVAEFAVVTTPTRPRPNARVVTTRATTIRSCSPPHSGMASCAASTAAVRGRRPGSGWKTPRCARSS